MHGRTDVAVVVALLASTPAMAAPVVVLDAGHGGGRLGALTPAGVAEKTIVLSIARAARAALAASRVTVVMTRTSDKHVPLDARVQLANARAAAVFVSIHANSSPVTTRRGAETYVLSARASDDVSAALIAHENDGLAIGAVDLRASRKGSDVQGILRDLKRVSAHTGSAHLAKRIQDAMAKVPALGPSRGLRQAPFKVLKGPTMPSVLVEVGYTSHPVQSRALATSRVQKAAGKAIASGILAFMRRDR